MLFGFFIIPSKKCILYNTAIGYNCIIYKIYCILTVRLAFSFSVQNAFAPILHWRHATVLPEFPNQMARICKTHIVGYFLDRHTTVRDQIFAPFHSVSVYILPKSLVKMRPKITTDVPLGQPEMLRKPLGLQQFGSMNVHLNVLEHVHFALSVARRTNTAVGRGIAAQGAGGKRQHDARRTPNKPFGKLAHEFVFRLQSAKTSPAAVRSRPLRSIFGVLYDK